MNQNAIQILEYNKIKEKVMAYAMSEQGKALVEKLEPSVDVQAIEQWLRETTEARNIVEKSGGIPLQSLAGMEKVVGKLGKTAILQPEELAALGRLLDGVRRMRRFMRTMETVAPSVSAYALSMFEVEDLREEITRCIANEAVDDRATNELYKIRKKMLASEEKIKTKLEGFLKSHSAAIQEAFVSMRNGRYVIPVKKEYRKNIEGNVLDTSASGSTLFIEPQAVKNLQDELDMLKIEDEKEVYKILSGLTGLAESYQREILLNIEVMANYDFLFAKAKYSAEIKGNTASLNTKNRIFIKGGRHPLIGSGAVPLDFAIGDDYKALVITGPNTGGKTVVLKTVGLLTMMIQSGLHVPVEEGSEFAIFRDILADIGDGQSIEQSLSTFSSHIKNIGAILQNADPYTLVIVDELGAGTDPGEGMGLAISIMEAIFGKGATMLATTHYSEIKDFAAKAPGFQNGCMEFDIETLRPAYRLRIGEAGESNAFLIALRLGIDKAIIERAHEVTYKESRDYTDYVAARIQQKRLEEAANRAEDGAKPAQIPENRQAQIEKLKASQEAREKQKEAKPKESFKIGDCVHIGGMDRTGIVCELENKKGEVGVMVMKNKFKINKKRLSLYIEGGSLYPEDYDFDIIFESKENRKNKRRMEKGHGEGIEIEIKKARV